MIKRLAHQGDPAIHIVYYIAYLYESQHLSMFTGILIGALLCVYAAVLIDRT